MEQEKTQQQSLEEFISQELKANKEKIIREGIEGVKKGVAEEVKWRISREIANSIEDVFKDAEMKANMAVAMGEFKKGFVEHLTKAFQEQLPSIASEIAMQMQKRAIKNLTKDSYSMSDVYKKIFE